MSDESGPWTGISGTAYIYYVFEREVPIPQRMGNYIYAKKNSEDLWVPVYMGHGDLSVQCTDPALLECINSKGATHVHLRLNSLEEDRVAELHDLLERYQNAFPPDGCNSKEDRSTTQFATPRPEAEPG